MHCKYCNENSIIFDLVEAMEFEYIVVGAYWVNQMIFNLSPNDIDLRNFINTPTLN